MFYYRSKGLSKDYSKESIPASSMQRRGSTYINKENSAFNFPTFSGFEEMLADIGNYKQQSNANNNNTNDNNNDNCVNFDDIPM